MNTRLKYSQVKAMPLSDLRLLVNNINNKTSKLNRHSRDLIKHIYTKREKDLIVDQIKEHFITKTVVLTLNGTTYTLSDNKPILTKPLVGVGFLSELSDEVATELFKYDPTNTKETKETFISSILYGKGVMIGENGEGLDYLTPNNKEMVWFTNPYITKIEMNSYE